MNKTGIDYLTHTWNPIKMRCDRVSAGCTNCWHLTVCDNSIKNPNIPEKLKEVYRGGSFYLDEKEFIAPLKYRKPAMIGVQFMGDLFHPDVPFEWVDRVMAVMALCPEHTFQVLTKRPERMKAYFDSNPHTEYADSKRIGRYFLEMCLIPKLRPAWCEVIWPFPNLWLGVTAENQEMADKRIPILVQIPAAMRFVSIEPMLDQVRLDAVQFPTGVKEDVLRCQVSERAKKAGVDKLNGIDWVIVGCESGPGSRPCKIEWVDRIVMQCKDAGVPCFVKQIDVDGKVVKMPVGYPQEFPK